MMIINRQFRMVFHSEELIDQWCLKCHSWWLDDHRSYNYHVRSDQLKVWCGIHNAMNGALTGMIFHGSIGTSWGTWYGSIEDTLHSAIFKTWRDRGRDPRGDMLGLLERRGPQNFRSTAVAGGCRWCGHDFPDLQLFYRYMNGGCCW